MLVAAVSAKVLQRLDHTEGFRQMYRSDNKSSHNKAAEKRGDQKSGKSMGKEFAGGLGPNHGESGPGNAVPASPRSKCSQCGSTAKSRGACKNCGGKMT